MPTVAPRGRCDSSSYAPGTTPERIVRSRNCARCDWRPTEGVDVPPRMQAIEHAQESDHRLCSVCSYSLDPTEPVVCEHCLTKARERLAQVVELYALLPEELEHPSAHAALVLLGPGSDGSAFRDMTRREWKLNAGASKHRLGLPGREHGVDNRAGDGTSVVFVLGNWEIDWRETWGEEPVEVSSVMTAAGYLERRMRRAANGDRDHPAHDAFAEFAIELARLLEEMEAAAHRGNRPEIAPVACFDCGHVGSLRRAHRSPDPCEHHRPPFPPAYVVDSNGQLVRDADDKPIPVPLSERRARHDADLKQLRTDHARCDQGGLSPHWICRLCERPYTDEEYMLALGDSMREVAKSYGWGSVWDVATLLGVPVRTVRAWVDRGKVTSACSVETQRVIVWWPDARDMATRRSSRRRVG